MRKFLKRPLYNVWQNMKYRSKGTNDAICNRWLNSYICFAIDIHFVIGKKPNSRYRLRRINKSKMWDKTNIKWTKHHTVCQNNLIFGNTSGVNGVSFNFHLKKWQVGILGKWKKNFKNKNDAIAYRKSIKIPQNYQDDIVSRYYVGE